MGVSVLVEAPQGVQAAERVVVAAFLPSSPMQPLTLRRLQEALLGHPLLPLPASLHGEGLGRQRGQQLQRRGSRRRRADTGPRLREWLVVGCWWCAGGDCIQTIGGWWRCAVGGGGERWTERGRGLGVRGGAGELEHLDVTQRGEVGQDGANLLFQAKRSLHGGVCGARRADAELGDGGLDGADGHVTTEDKILLGLLSGVRLQRERQKG